MFSSDEWITLRKGRLTYGGRMARRPFEAWLRTTKGSKVLAAAATRVQFALFSKDRVAARKLWRGLAAAGREPAVVAAIQNEIDGYVQRLEHLVYSEGLPQTTIGLRRLIALPCVIVNSASYGSLETHVGRVPAIADLSGGSWLRDFVFLEVLRQVESAIERAAPSAKRPIQAGQNWVSIGFNPTFAWHVPFKGPAWNGHHYLMELTHEPVTRAIRNSAAQKVQALESAVSALSKENRGEILKRANSTTLVTGLLKYA